MATSKSIVVDLNKDEKLIGDNYNIWHHKVQLVLDEQEVLEVLNLTINPSNPNSSRREIELYEKWNKKHSKLKL